MFSWKRKMFKNKNKIYSSLSPSHLSISLHKMIYIWIITSQHNVIKVSNWISDAFIRVENVWHNIK